MYTTDITRKFKNKGFYDPERKVLVSTSRNTEGNEYDIIEALELVGSDGSEVDITITQKEQIDTVSEDME